MLLLLNLSLFALSCLVITGKPQNIPNPAALPPAFHVCLDPGHPSETSAGTEQLNGLREVTVVWQVAQKVKAQMEREGIRVTLTKQSEREMVTNKKRAEIANQSHADLLLRIHADAGGGRGYTVYYPRRQGRVNGVTGPSERVLHISAQAAKPFHQGIAAALQGQLNDNGLRGDEQSFVGGKQGALTGSIYSEVPTVLIEMCFLDNAHDADWIRTSENQERMAQAIVRGVLRVRDSRIQGKRSSDNAFSNAAADRTGAENR